MTGPQLGICDAHPGIHQRSDGTDRQSATPCVGWMVYEPFLKPVPFPETPEVSESRIDHEPMLPAPGIDNVPSDQCGECGEAHVVSESRIDYVSRIEYRHTHRSVNDGSPAMRLAKAVGKIWLMNEDGYTWVANASEWEEIS